jgi:hypothetical protein
MAAITLISREVLMRTKDGVVDHSPVTFRLRRAGLLSSQQFSC